MQGPWPIPCRSHMFASCKKQMSWCCLCKPRATWNEVCLYLCWKWVLCLVVFGCVGMWWYVVSSLFCWLRRCWRRCVGCCVVVTVKKKKVPVLHVEQICTRLRKLRVVLQELEQDDDEVVTPRPETQHCGHEQRTKAQIRGKRDDFTCVPLCKRKNGVCNFKKNVPRENLSPLRF